MRSNYQAYDHIASALRMNAILNQSDVDYTEVQSLPDRSKLTYGNGFYANCTAVFIDIRARPSSRKFTEGRLLPGSIDLTLARSSP